MRLSLFAVPPTYPCRSADEFRIAFDLPSLFPALVSNLGAQAQTGTWNAIKELAKHGKCFSVSSKKTDEFMDDMFRTLLADGQRFRRATYPRVSISPR